MISTLPDWEKPASFLPPTSGPRPTSGSGDETAFAAEMLETSVLVVEDEMMIAWQVCDLLEEMGFQSVQAVGKFQDALAAAERDPPALLICDINLGPGPDGIAIASALASDEKLQVIFITAYAGDEIRTRIKQFDRGAKLLRKPVQAKILKDTILQMLGASLN